MDQFMAQANIDHYLELLQDGTRPPNDGSMIHRLSLQEENKLARSQEQLDFVEIRVAKLRQHYDQLSSWRDGFEEASPERAKADAMVEKSKFSLYLLEAYCGQMRRHLNGR